MVHSLMSTTYTCMYIYSKPIIKSSSIIFRLEMTKYNHKCYELLPQTWSLIFIYYNEHIIIRTLKCVMQTQEYINIALQALLTIKSNGLAAVS